MLYCTQISTVPTAANAGYYASIVAVLRRLVKAGTGWCSAAMPAPKSADAEVVGRARRPKSTIWIGGCQGFVALRTCNRRWTDVFIASSGG